MKWFKHEDTSNNAKIEMLMDKHGLKGYGFYFKTLEIISTNIKEDNKEDWGFIPSEYTTEYLRRKYGVTSEEHKIFLETCISLNLFKEINGRIYCEKILYRGDDYLGRLLKNVKNEAKNETTEKIRSNSGVGTEKLRSNSGVAPEQEENRIKEKRERGDKELARENSSKDEEVSKSVEYLQGVPDADVDFFITQYAVSGRQVQEKGGELFRYCKMHGKMYEDYRVFLESALAKDFGKRKSKEEENKKLGKTNLPELPELTKEEKEKADKKLQEIRDKLKK